MRSFKENSSGTRGRARLQVGGGLRLFVRLCYRLLFPVKTGKGEKKKGGGIEDRVGLEKCCLDVCWSEVQLCLSVRLAVTLPDRKNRPIEGVALSGIVGGVIFITFTKGVDFF